MTTKTSGSFGFHFEGISTAGEGQLHVKRVEEMEILGVLVDARGSTETALKHNIAKEKKVHFKLLGHFALPTS